MINLLLIAVLGAYFTITAPLRLLPDVSLSSNISSAISYANSAIVSMGFIVPVSTLVAIFVAFLVVETAIWSYKLIMWSIKKIPGIS
jgi:hypothetical protein